MKQLFIGIAIAAFLVACKSKDKEKEPAINPSANVDSTLITDSAWGLISAATNFDELKKIFGEGAVKDERICGPECVDSLDVTILYPGTNNESIIYWKDSFYHKQIGMIDCYSDSAAWHTAAGIKIGSGMKELLQLNGKRINFSGFGWDYGGSVISYNGGALDKSKIHYNLDLIGDNDYGLSGDTELHTDSVIVQKALDKIVVRKIGLSFYKE